MGSTNKTAFGAFSAVVVLFATLAVIVASRTSEMMTEEAERTVKGAVKETTVKVDRQLLAVEAVTRNFAWVVGEHLLDPDYMYLVTRELVENNDFIVGSAVAFEPDFYKEKGRLYAPYSCVSTNGQVKSFPLPYDYLAQEWYRHARNSRRAGWCEPYFDKDGGGIMMCTYSVPLTNETGEVYAVLTSDISLDYMAERISEICPYPQSYAVMISAMGQYLVLPPHGRTFERTDRTITIRDKTENGWVVAVVCPMENILRGAHRLVAVIVIFAAVGLLIIILISWAHSKRVQRESALRERLSKELDIAHQIQSAVMPKEFPAGIHAVLSPSPAVGGDICDFVSRDDKVYFLVGDAAGSGVSAVIFSFVAGMVFRAICRENLGPETILCRINEALVIDNEQSLFMTAVVGVLDRRTGELRYGGAGRIPLIVVTPAGEVTVPEVKGQPPLGVSNDSVYAAQSLQVAKGSKVLALTDGVLNAGGVDGVPFGKDRVLACLAACADKSAAETVGGLMTAIHEFTAGCEQADDLAVLALES